MTENSVKYTVSLNPGRHEMAVELSLSGPCARGDIPLNIPTWVPGDYSFDTHARDLFNLRAVNPQTGAVLAVERNGWQGFVVRGADGAATITYTASAYCTDFGEPCGILDDEYAILLGTRYLFTPLHSGPCQVRYLLPDGWTRIHHPSGARALADNTWEYPDYEILLDTPVALGKFDLIEKTVHGTPIYSLFVDRGIGFPQKAEAFASQLAEVARQCFAIFGSFPFSDYTFIMSLNPDAEWGLEHLTSTMCGLGPSVFILPDQTAHGVRVCAHEMFHAWNVRRLRPAPLKDLQHQLSCGCFTEGLWVAEGFTRYYEYLLSTRAGAYTPGQFFSAVMGYYNHLTVQPAYQRVSGVDSSLATYLNHSKYAGRVNNSIDYYDKGMLIAFEADVALRLRAGSSLDEAFSAFYREYVDGGPGYPGYTTGDVIAFFESRLPGLGAQMEAGAAHPGGLAVPRFLENLGFRLEATPGNYLGLVFLNDLGPTIYNVADTSPAGQSGIAAGDEITAIDGYAFSGDALKWVAAQTAPVTLTVQRGHRLLSFTLAPVPLEPVLFTSMRWQGSAGQAAQIASWLGQAFDPGQGELFSFDFYENFHGIETMI